MANRVEVKSHGNIVAIRKLRKHGRPYFMGTVMLKNVVLRSDSMEGDWLAEWEEERELTADALKHLRRVVDTDLGFMDGAEFNAYIEALDEWIESGSEGDEPAMPDTLTDNTYRAAYVCGNEFYVG